MTLTPFPSELLRRVKLETGHVLSLWDTFKTDSYGKSILAYELAAPNGGEATFKGADFHCSPMYPIDSDDALRSLLGFLTLRPGDTDSEYFEDYTAAQLEFAETYGEELACIYAEPEDSEEPIGKVEVEE